MDVAYWQTESRRMPVYDFIKRQPNEAAQRIMKNVEHFAEQGLGLLTSPGKVKALSGYPDLYELKIDFRGVFYRIIFCVTRGIAHLLLAFKKKSNHTPLQYIKTALARQRLLSI